MRRGRTGRRPCRTRPACGRRPARGARWTRTDRRRCGARAAGPGGRRTGPGRSGGAPAARATRGLPGGYGSGPGGWRGPTGGWGGGCSWDRLPELGGGREVEASGVAEVEQRGCVVRAIGLFRVLERPEADVPTLGEDLRLPLASPL